MSYVGTTSTAEYSQLPSEAEIKARMINKAEEEYGEKLRLLFPDAGFQSFSIEALDALVLEDVPLTEVLRRNDTGLQTPTVPTSYHCVWQSYPNMQELYGKNVLELEPKQVERLASGSSLSRVLGRPTETKALKNAHSKRTNNKSLSARKSNNQYRRH